MANPGIKTVVNATVTAIDSDVKLAIKPREAFNFKTSHATATYSLKNTATAKAIADKINLDGQSIYQKIGNAKPGGLFLDIAPSATAQGSKVLVDIAWVNPAPTPHKKSALVMAFEAKFPWDDKNYRYDINAGGGTTKLTVADLPKGSAAAKMANDIDSSTSSGQYLTTDIYKTKLLGRPVIVVEGSADATDDLGIFDAISGKRLASDN